MEKKDGMEVLHRILFSLPLLTIIFGAPAGFLAVHFKLPMFRHFSADDILIDFALVSFVAFALLIDWVLVLNFSYFVLLHVNSTFKWQVKLRQAWYEIYICCY
jgi:hypothetical protein